MLTFGVNGAIQKMYSFQASALVSMQESMLTLGVNGSLEIRTGAQHSDITMSSQKCWLHFLKAFPSGSLKEI